MTVEWRHDREAFARSILAHLAQSPQQNVDEVRRRVWNVFLSVVQGSTDAPRGKSAEDLATLFYTTHLLLVLFWLQDLQLRSLAWWGWSRILRAFAICVYIRFDPGPRMKVVARLFFSLWRTKRS